MGRGRRPPCSTSSTTCAACKIYGEQTHVYWHRFSQSARRQRIHCSKESLRGYVRVATLRSVSSLLCFAVGGGGVTPPSQSVCWVPSFRAGDGSQRDSVVDRLSVVACRRRCGTALGGCVFNMQLRATNGRANVKNNLFIAREIYPHLAMKLCRCLLELQHSPREFLGRNQNRNQRSSDRNGTCRRKM